MLHAIVANQKDVYIIEGPSIDLNQAYTIWVESKIGKRPVWPHFLKVSKEYYEFEAELEHYHEEMEKLRVDDFLIYLRKQGYSHIVCPQVALFDGSWLI